MKLAISNLIITLWEQEYSHIEGTSHQFILLHKEARQGLFPYPLYYSTIKLLHIHRDQLHPLMVEHLPKNLHLPLLTTYMTPTLLQSSVHLSLKKKKEKHSHHLSAAQTNSNQSPKANWLTVELNYKFSPSKEIQPVPKKTKAPQPQPAASIRTTADTQAFHHCGSPSMKSQKLSKNQNKNRSAIRTPTKEKKADNDAIKPPQGSLKPLEAPKTLNLPFGSKTRHHHHEVQLLMSSLAPTTTLASLPASNRTQLPPKQLLHTEMKTKK